MLTELTVNGVGVATADSELRHVGDNKSAVCTVNLAFNRSFKRNGDDEWQKEVTFMKAQIWGNKAEKMAETVKKGQPICIDGNLKQNSWNDDEGNKRVSFLINLRDFQLCVRNAKRNDEPAKKSEPVTADSSDPVSNDDIPF